MGEDFRETAIVSCDIVGHSETDATVQLGRVSSLNELVGRHLTSSTAHTVWASGGDGGHVLFFGTAWAEPALRLATKLKEWATLHGVPLRVGVHSGEVASVEGADGREQPVGNGINEAGALLELISDAGVVVSTRFRDAIEPLGLRAVRFHDERELLLRGRVARRFVLLSTDSVQSSWETGSEDRTKMRAAAVSGDAWETLYHAMRLLQVSGTDAEVNQVLRKLHPEDFRTRGGRSVNPLFGYLEPRALREVIKSSHLVERAANQVLCRYGDEGDRMFVVLHGSVGVYNSEGTPARGDRGPEFSIGEGEVVGELAFLLRRRRTADLITLADTALLSFSLDEISARLASSTASAGVLERVEQFMTSRILEHVAHNVPFLIGDNDEGPLGSGMDPADSLLEDLQFESRTVSVPSARGTLSLAALTDGSAEQRGLYILVSGRLESDVVPGVVLDGETFPLVYVDLDPHLLGPDHRYNVRDGVRLLHIGQPAVDALPDACRSALLATLTDEVAAHYLFDAFISYNLGDEAAVERWNAALTAAGLRVYVDVAFPGERFTSKIQAALMNSLTVLAFVSPHTMTKPAASNWVLKEIAFREQNFASPWIIPIALRGADLDAFGLRYTMIDARHNEAAAIADAVTTVRAIRSGVRRPPILRARALHTELT